MNNTTRYVLRNTETGMIVDTFDTEAEATEAMEMYEQDDRNGGVYEEGVYEIQV